MQFPALTGAYAVAFGLIYALLSAWVTAGRAQYGVHHGDGGHIGLARRIRAHANFSEYVPFILLLAALAEAHGAAASSIHALLAVLLVARLAHPLGMLAPEASAAQYGLRGTSAFATWLVLIGSSALLYFHL